MMNNVNAPENLKVKVSTFQTELSFNEWVKELNVSRDYVEPTQYYQGNVFKVPEPTFWEEMRRLFLIKVY